ncbi:D-2-hydroxyacid dehydrogenase [Lysinimonas soli]|uniref:D-2-hydroxyacid dehydrogenase n=1 Tax=Lysinimonas soli TaxID=1074233 RepID=A0ABW0NJY1_9MICO
MPDRLRVVVATPQTTENVELLRDREPRLDVVYEPGLLGSPSEDWTVRHLRTRNEQARFDAIIDTAEALFGVPDNSGESLARTVAANPGLRWVHTIPAGGGQQVKAAHLDQDSLTRILFTTSAGVHAEPLAEFAVFGVLAGAKLLPRLHAAQIRHEWLPRVPFGLALDMTVAVVGLGSIGRLTASKLAALGYHVVGVHRRTVEAPGVERVHPVERLAEVAATADAVVLALPGTAQTEGMLSREVLAAIKPGASIVNVGRGSTVDEPALIQALSDGRVGFAALDVTAVEPLPGDSPLWDMPNVLISPHTAATSLHEPRLITELFARNATAFLDGRPLENIVNTIEFY